MAQAPATPAQPPKRFLPALVTASESNRTGDTASMDATQAQQFEDYKRRHSKQNRDIIKTNADRAMRIRNLEDENTHLQMEIINIRHEKSIVVEELRRERERANKIRNNPEVKQALDVLLLAIPQITQLRSLLSFSPSPSSSSSSRRPNSQPSSSTDPSDGRSTNARTRSRGLEPATKKIEVQTWLNRPMIVKAGKPSLENLAEGVEEAGDDLRQVEMLVEATVPVQRPKKLVSDVPSASSKTIPNKPAGRRQSGLFRPVADEPSNPFDPANAGSMDIPLPSDIFDVRKSPKKRPEAAETSSPSVKPVSSNMEPVRRSPRKKAARPNYAQDEQEEEVVPVESVKGKERAVASPTKVGVRKRRSLKPVEGGLALRLETPAEAAEHVEEAEIGMSVERGENEPQRSAREVTPPLQVAAVHEQTLMRMAKAASGPVVAPVVVLTASQVTELEIREEEEAGGRQRRARKSVNYKEPNLHFKMRKPESVSSGHLYVSGPAGTSSNSRARSTTPSNTPGRKNTLQSVLDETDIPNIPVVPAGLRAEAGLKGDGQYGLSNLEPVNAGIMRRKSVLPKSRRVEALSENGQNDQGGGSDHELPTLKDQVGTLGGEIEKISSRRRARLGTPEAGNVDSPSQRLPLQPVLNSSQSSTESLPEIIKPDDGVVRRARRRSTLFQTSMAEA